MIVPKEYTIRRCGSTDASAVLAVNRFTLGPVQQPLGKILAFFHQSESLADGIKNLAHVLDLPGVIRLKLITRHDLKEITQFLRDGPQNKHAPGGQDALKYKRGTPAIIEEYVDTYDLAVSGTHNYFAGGVLVHNKDRSYIPGIDDPWYFFWPRSETSVVFEWIGGPKVRPCLLQWRGRAGI